MMNGKNELQQCINKVSSFYAQFKKADGEPVEDLGVLAESYNKTIGEIEFSPKDIPILAMYLHLLQAAYSTMSPTSKMQMQNQAAHHIRAIYDCVDIVLFEQIETWVYG